MPDNDNSQYLVGTQVRQNANGMWEVALKNPTNSLGYDAENPTIYSGGLSTAMPTQVSEAATSISTVQAANAIGDIAVTIGNAITGFNNAKTAKAVAQYQAQIQENNARMAELSALSALNQSQWKIAAITMRAGKVKSSQKVAMAANGIKVGVGSSAAILATTDLMKRLDVNTEYANGYRAAWGYRMNAVQANMKATALHATAASASPFATGATYFAAGILDTYKNFAKRSK